MATIGIFDSGVGGLSVLREVLRTAPRHRVVYLADQAHAPYGERSADEVRARAFASVDELLARGADVAVLACHSASAAALHELREAHPRTPFVGMEPAVKPAAEMSARRRIGVLATSVTLQGALFRRVVERHARHVEVIARPCPGWVEAVERLELDGPAVREMVAADVAPLVRRGVDALVLGCTHFPFLRRHIDAAAAGVVVVDPSAAIARRTVEVLADAPPSPAAPSFLTTGDADRFATQVARLLPEVDGAIVTSVLP